MSTEQPSQPNTNTSQTPITPSNTAPTESKIKIKELGADEIYEGKDKHNDDYYDIEKANKLNRDKLFKELFPSANNEIYDENTDDIVAVFKAQHENLLNSNKNFINKKAEKIDPFNKLKSLENELKNVSNEINDYVSMYKENNLLKKAENFEDILKDLDIYAKKLQNIMDSQIYKEVKSGGENANKKEASTLNAEIKKNLEDYTNSTKKLMAIINKLKVNTNEQSILEEYTKNYSFIVDKNIINQEMNKENELKALEDKLASIEKTVGNFSVISYNNKSISDEIKLALNFTEEKLNKSAEQRKIILVNLSEVLDFFKEQKANIKTLAEYYIKIKDLYNMLGLYESYENIFEYVRKRLKAIKIIHESSDTFNENVQYLSEKLTENEKNFGELGKLYGETFDEFSKIEEILKQVKSIEDKIMTKIGN